MRRLVWAVLAVWVGVVLVVSAQATAAAPDARTEVAAAVYHSAESMKAFAQYADERMRADAKRIAMLEDRVRAGKAKATELAAAQEALVTQLAEKDRAYATAIAAFRGTVTDIASTPEGAAALAQYNAGDEVGALAILKKIRAAHDAARKLKENIESAAEGRRIAELALDARNKGKVPTAEVIALYEDVTHLDPGVFWDWVTLRRLYSDAGRLADARRAAERAAKTAGGDRDRSVALNEQGDVLVSSGDLFGARKADEEALAIARRLSAADPGNASAQRDVSVSVEKLGDVLVSSGDLSGARKAYEEDLAIARRLSAADPGNAEALRDVSISLDRLGNVLVSSGDLSGARKAYEESLSTRRRLSAADPGNASAQRDVMVSLVKMTQFPDSGIHWSDVLAKLEEMQVKGILAPTDEKWISIARERAAQEKAK